MIFRRRYRSPTRAISWLLVAAIIALTIQPMHLHLQHTGDDSSLIHDHVVDLHLAVENIDPSNHEDAMVFSATPDGLVKKIDANQLLMLLCFYLSILVLNTLISSKPLPLSRTIQPERDRFSIRPPLRAPPRS